MQDICHSAAVDGRRGGTGGRRSGIAGGASGPSHQPSQQSDPAPAGPAGSGTPSAQRSAKRTPAAVEADVPQQSQAYHSSSNASWLPICIEPPPLVMVAFMDKGESSLFTKRLDDTVNAPMGGDASKPTILVQLPDTEERMDRAERFNFSWKEREGGRGCWCLRSDEFMRGPYKAVLGFSSADPACPPTKLSGRVNEIRFEVNLVMSNCDEASVHFFSDESLQMCLDVEGGASCLRYIHLWRSATPRLRAAHLCDRGLGLPFVPRFRKDANGTPTEWNKPDNLPKGDPKCALFWSKQTRSIIPKLPKEGKQRLANVNHVIEFLRMRDGSNRKPVGNLLRPPLRFWDGWFCFPLREFKDEADEVRWKRAWHGCKFEAMYSILYSKKLRQSADKGRGERCLANVSGVYCHKDGTASKAENYMRYVPLFGDGTFWAAKWEVRVDKSTRVKVPTTTDQWVFPEEGVRLAALWICGRTANEMVPGAAVSREWDPLEEAHPLRILSSCGTGSLEAVSEAAPKPAPKRQPKKTSGVMLVDSPAFLRGHTAARSGPDRKGDGFNRPSTNATGAPARSRSGRGGPDRRCGGVSHRGTEATEVVVRSRSSRRCPDRRVDVVSRTSGDTLG